MLVFGGVIHLPSIDPNKLPSRDIRKPPLGVTLERPWSFEEFSLTTTTAKSTTWCCCVGGVLGKKKECVSRSASPIYHPWMTGIIYHAWMVDLYGECRYRYAIHGCLYILDLFFGDLFTDCTTVNRHETPPFGRICLELFPSILRKSRTWWLVKSSLVVVVI